MRIDPYLFFNGRAEEAAHFYREALGAELQFLMRYGESPEPHPPGMVPPGSDNLVMHASMKFGDTTLMLSDDCSPDAAKLMHGFTLSISAADAAGAEKFYNALVAGGQVVMPPGKTFWSPWFGMLKDRFGVGWMVSVPGEM